jgi:hypothetical protein
MKKLFLLFGIVIIALAGCNDDEEDVAQLSFTYPNMATLIGQSGSYIKQASPGTFYQYVERVDYSYYTYLFDDITILSDMVINYYLVDDACDDIFIYTESAELATAQELMRIATQELGEASVYVLDFILDSITIVELKFYTYAELLDYIAAKSFTVEDIYELYSAYAYLYYTTYAGGYWDEGEFWPYVEIVALTKKSTTAQPPCRRRDGKLKRRGTEP